MTSIRHRLNENVPYIEACASFDEKKGSAAIFLINRSWEEELEVALDIERLYGLPPLRPYGACAGGSLRL